jgi:predicted dehydrogenase
MRFRFVLCTLQHLTHRNKKAMANVRFVVIGLGGYGLVHIDAIRWLARQGLARLVGVVALEVDRKARPQVVADLVKEGVTLYGSVDDFFERGVGTTDVLTVPIGIHQHVPVAVRALEAGLHVYCEKPVAATIQEVDRLIAAWVASDRKVAIGYQHIYSVSIQRLKELISTGRMGRIRRIALMCSWPRSVQYFHRNDWTGRLRVDGDWILDSPANNAHAHYVLNALYLASPRPDTAALPVSVKAELWRAHRIESADTVQAHITTDDGTEVQVFVTHSGFPPSGPIMQITAERGSAYWMTDEGWTTVRLSDGHQEVLDNRSSSPLWRFGGFKNFADAINGTARIICTPEIARAQTLAVNLMHESCPVIGTVPEESVTELEDWEMYPPNTKGIFRRIRDIDPAMFVAFHEGAFLSELGLPWTTGIKSKTVSGVGYRHYPAE